MIRPREFACKYVLEILTLIGIFICFISSFPGHTNFDEFNSLNEFFLGNLSDIQPPAHSIIWGSSIALGEKLGLLPIWQVSLLLIAQLTIFWACMLVLTKSFSNKIIALLFFSLVCFAPISILYISHIGKDTQMAITFFASCILTHQAINKKNIFLLLPSIFLLLYGFVLRSNAPAGAIILIIYWSYGLTIISNKKLNTRKVIASISIIIFIIFIALSQNLSKFTIKNNCCKGIQLIMTPIQELMAISYEINKNLIPAQFYADPNYNLESIKKNFDPTYPNWEGLKITDYEYLPLALSAWYEGVNKYPKIYIRYKFNFLKNFYGFNSGDIPFSVFQGFYTNDLVGTSSKVRSIVAQVRNMPNFWLKIKETFSKYFSKSRNSLCFRFWPYLASALASFLLLPKQKRYTNSLTLALFLSAISYSIPYIFIASSVSIRYNLWPILALTSVLFINLDKRFPKESR